MLRGERVGAYGGCGSQPGCTYNTAVVFTMEREIRIKLEGCPIRDMVTSRRNDGHARSALQEDRSRGHKT